MSIALALVMVVPMTLRIDATVPRKMVDRAMIEAAAIWRDAGVELQWDVAPSIPARLHVEFGDARGHATPSELPIAWIGLRDERPDDEIYVSRANALDLLEATGRMNDLPVAAVNEWIGRALGRALAHEIGHYLFQSPAHDAKGVMATKRSTVELFGIERRAFLLTPAERGRLAFRLQGDRVAKRAAPPFD